MLIAQFTLNAKPIMKQIKFLREHNQKLSKVRNLLLPRLMNGEITV